MSKACMHVPRDIPGKVTYLSRRIFNKQVCRACGWIRENSMPVDAQGIWIYEEWRPPSRIEKQREENHDAVERHLRRAVR